MKSGFENREQMLEAYLELREKLHNALAHFEETLVSSNVDLSDSAGVNPKDVFSHYDGKISRGLDDLGCALGILNYLVAKKEELDHAFINKDKMRLANA